MEGRRRTERRVPMLAFAGVLLLLGAAETVNEMANTEPDESVFPKVVYLLAYLRGRRVTVREALFNWAVVVTVAVVAPLMYLE